jgi:hypothetical protein
LRRLLVVIAWLIVAVPLAWGVLQSILNQSHFSLMVVDLHRRADSLAIGERFDITSGTTFD